MLCHGKKGKCEQVLPQGQMLGEAVIVPKAPVTGQGVECLSRPSEA